MHIIDPIEDTINFLLERRAFPTFFLGEEKTKKVENVFSNPRKCHTIQLRETSQ